MKKFLLLAGLVFSLMLGGYAEAKPSDAVKLVYSGHLLGRLDYRGWEKYHPPVKAGDFVSLYRAVKELQPDLEVDLGDSLLGADRLSDYYHGKPMAELFSRMQYDALLFGEAEARLYPPELQFINAKVRLLGGTSRCNSLYLPPEPVIKKIKGKTIAVFGAFLPDAKKTYPSLDFTLNWNAFLASVKHTKADFKILLLNCPDLETLPAMKPFDLVILAGFSPQVNPKALTRYKGSVFAPAVDSRFRLGEIQITPQLLGRGKISLELIPVQPQDKTPTPEIFKQISRKYPPPIASPDYRAVREAFLGLGSDRLTSPLDKPEKGLASPSPLLIADLMREAGKTQIALSNPLALRGGLAGILRLDDLGKALPFWNELVTMELTGSQIQELRASSPGVKNREALCLSDPALPTDKLNYRPRQAYLTATNNYLASGARGKAPVFLKGKRQINSGLLINYLLLDKIEAENYLFPPNQDYRYAGEAEYRLRGGRIMEAQISLQQELKTHPTPEGYFLLGLTRLDMQRPREAVLPLQQSLKLDPGNPEPHLLLILAYLKDFNYPRAKKAVLAADRRFPGNPNLLKLLSLFRSEKASGSTGAGPAQAPWPKFRGGLQNTGRSPYAGPDLGRLKWKFKAHQHIFSSPALDKAGNLYFASVDQYFYSLNSQGKIRFKAKLGNSSLSSPALASDGSLYLGCADGGLYGFTAEGKAKFVYQTGGAVKSSPAIGFDGTVYFGSDDGNFYALDSAGNLKWKYPTSQEIFGSPALGKDGTVYFGGKDQKMHALTPQGKLKWAFLTHNRIIGSPCVGDDGSVYFGSDDHFFYALTPQGKVKWKYRAGEKIPSSPAIAKDGSLYFGSDDGALYALNSAGKLKWKFQADSDIFSSVAIDKNGRLYFGGEDNCVYCLSPRGKVIWKFAALDYLESSPALGPGNSLYIGCEDGNLYCISP